MYGIKFPRPHPAQFLTDPKDSWFGGKIATKNVKKRRDDKMPNCIQQTIF